jgi:hypothetical protein
MVVWRGRWTAPPHSPPRLSPRSSITSDQSEIGSRSAANGPRRVRYSREPTMKDCGGGEAATLAATCTFPPIPTQVYSYELHRRNSSWDLIRKRSEVQVLAGPLHLRRSAGLYLVSDRRFRIRFGARAATGSKSALPDVLPERWESRSLGRAVAGQNPGAHSASA